MCFLPRLKNSAKFPKNVLKRTDGAQRYPSLTASHHRQRDGRDFDDAAYCEKDEGYRLYVAIADVSHYVRPNDAIDQEAFNREIQSFPRRVIPMLPEALSNELCSLNPDKNRLCMVCEIQFHANGNILDYSFYPASCCHMRA